MSAGTPAEREATRQKLRDHALAHALDHHVTTLCRGAMAEGWPGKDHGCAGQWNCLCICHDSPVAEILARNDEPVSAP